jgi:uncharacterized repeat protein (TIGR02543 family)
MYEPENDNEESAPVLDLETNKTFMGYLHTGDIDYYRIKLGDTSPEPDTVTFDANDATSGTAPAPRTVTVNSNNITLPDAGNLEKTGYLFGGWNTRADGTGANYAADSSYAVFGNITLYAKWTEPVMVSFDTKGVETQIIYPGDTATFPAEPILSSYGFVNWYSDSELTTVYDFSAPVNEDITLHAKWFLYQYELGGPGPGGGKIFYRSAAGFTVNGLGTCHYLEAAPNDLSGTYAWHINASGPSTIPMIVANHIGDGRQNTLYTISNMGSSYVPAANACNNYSNNGKSDWYIPCELELNMLYNRRTYFTNLTGTYWTSNIDFYSSGFHPKYLNFDNGTVYGASNWNSSRKVRPIRAF